MRRQVIRSLYGVNIVDKFRRAGENIGWRVHPGAGVIRCLKTEEQRNKYLHEKKRWCSQM